MDQIDLTLSSIFHEPDDFSKKPQVEVDHYLRDRRSLDIGQRTGQYRNSGIIRSILKSCRVKHSRTSLLFKYDRGIDWHTAYAIILGKFPPGYQSEWEEDNACHRCGTSFNSPQNLGCSMLCWPCDLEMSLAYEDGDRYTPIGQLYR